MIKESTNEARITDLESQVRAAEVRLCTIEEQLRRANVRIGELSGESDVLVETRGDLAYNVDDGVWQGHAGRQSNGSEF